MVEEKNPTRFYKVECLNEEDSKILGEMIDFTRRKNIGLLGSGFFGLQYAAKKSVYFSYLPGQVLFSAINERTEEQLVQQFEEKLNESGLKWKTFDLGSLLEGVK